MPQDQSHFGDHYEVLVRLAKSGSWFRGDLESTLREVTEAAARTMGIERVNVWLFAEGRSKIRCIEHYQLSTDEHTSGGAEIAAADFPRYFQALEQERTIVADDARSDPRTGEFARGYLDVHGITSMLDAPLHSGGGVSGIICHEHVGEPRVWTEEEQRLAGSLADIASLALESSGRKRAEGALRQSRELTREIIAHTLDAIVIVDEDGVITDWNPRAEAIFGWSREQAVGLRLTDSVIPVRFHEDYRRAVQGYRETGESPYLDRRLEVSARDKKGREFPIELTVSPLRIGGSLAFSAFARDITDRVRAAMEIHELNAQLEERVQERTAQLESAVAEKERLLEELQASSVELLDRLCELEHKSETIRNDLARAQIIQRALLPGDPPRLEGVHVDALYRPGMSVGGDLYDVTLFEDGQLALYVADASGHGVAAAMLSVLFKQKIRMRGEDGEPLPPAEVLARVNPQLAADVPAQGLFLTVAYVLLDPRTGRLRAASAGHTPMLLHRARGDDVLLERTGPALGLTPEASYGEHELSLERDDRLMLYTDGLVEGLEVQEGSDLIALLIPALSGASAGGPERLRRLLADVERRGEGASVGAGRDDVTLVTLELSDGPCSFDNDPSGRAPAHESPAVGTPHPAPTLWIAESPDQTYLAVRGAGTWLNCEPFHHRAHAALSAGRRLTVDLAECSHLDSAFLGTLHETVAGRPEGSVDVCCPPPAIRGLFDELGLEGVKDCVQDERCRPPSEPMPVTQEPPARASQQRLLRAHEILSELSEENRRRFAGVVASLRAELESDD